MLDFCAFFVLFLKYGTAHLHQQAYYWVETLLVFK